MHQNQKERTFGICLANADFETAFLLILGGNLSKVWALFGHFVVELRNNGFECCLHFWGLGLPTLNLHPEGKTSRTCQTLFGP